MAAGDDAAEAATAPPASAPAGREQEDASVALMVVAGLPGCGKTSFCRALLERLKDGELELDSGLSLGGTVSWHHICYDSIEAELRGACGTFDPATWKAARERVGELVTQLMQVPATRDSSGDSDGIACTGRRVILLDDNMYYRSMRKKWYHFSRERRCVYRQVLLAAPMEVCLARNSSREPSGQVPEFSIRHMADVFEWPPGGGNSWESQEPVTTIIETSEASTPCQVESFIRRFCGAGAQRFWAPLPTEDHADGQGAEVQSSAHVCDLALRRIVSQALAHVPKDRGQVKSILAKRWGARKMDLVKQLASDIKGLDAAGDVEDLIHDMEGVFLKTCVVDIQEQLAVQ